MTPDEAHEILRKWAATGADPQEARLAWITLDALLQGDAELPEAWERLSSTAVAARLGKGNLNAWRDLVAKGYAPPADGHDDMGRSWWHPATIDAYQRGEWQRVPEQRDPDAMPPLSGPGATNEAWATWAHNHGLAVDESEGRVHIQQLCREAGLIA